MRTSGAKAALYMGSLARKGATGVEGYCLRTCRLAWDLGSDQGSAIAEWNSIPDKFKRTDPMKAPVGFPHFWKGGDFGHVALQAEHEGYVWSTDLPFVNHVGLIDIHLVEKRWGYKYLGWSLQFQNKILPVAPEAPKGK